MVNLRQNNPKVWPDPLAYGSPATIPTSCPQNRQNATQVEAS
jgi:hypothetical protein